LFADWVTPVSVVTFEKSSVSPVRSAFSVLSGRTISAES
jgi:hypothetical protein